MIEYYRIEVSERIEVNNKTNGSRECIICHYWYFIKASYIFQPKVYNGCHDLMLKAMNFNDFLVISFKGNDYRIHFLYMSKDGAKKFIMTLKKMGKEIVADIDIDNTLVSNKISSAHKVF